VKRVSAVAIINDNHILMGRRRSSGRFTNPGGHLNPGEDPVKGAAREVREETGIDLDPHLFKHLETRIVKKPDGEKLEVHGFRVDLSQRPSTTMKIDPDEEVQRWQWIKLDSDLDHIADNLHVPLKDNVLLPHVLRNKPMKKHIRRFWESSKKVGVHSFLEDVADKSLKEGPQQYLQYKDKKREKNAEDLIQGGKADNKADTSFPKDQLAKGMKVEREHTNNPALAKEIARDHLTEDKKYYDHLKKMEDKYVEKKAFWEGFWMRGSL
jgi:8-oxo-dGTP pyrophosphatase MutT (NUDIX family)